MNNNHRNNRSTAPRNNQEDTKNSYNKINTERRDTLIYAVRGLGEVDKNMYCLEHENEIPITDSGARFPEENLLGVDYVIPDYNYLVKSNRRRKVLIITHGHEDHIGGIPFLLKSMDIKAIYAPVFVVALINKRLEEHRMLCSVKIIEINDRSSVKMQYFTCGFFNTVHSIPDSPGTLINTPNGCIIHTGDLRFDLAPAGTSPDYQVMAYMGQIGVDLLLSDSTNSDMEGFSISGKKVAAEILDAMKKVNERLIVATFASNVYRVSQILEAVVTCGRKVIIFGWSMENAVTIGRKMGKIKVGEQYFLSPGQLGHTSANKTCIVCIGNQGEPSAVLSRIADGTHRYIKLILGDTVIFPSSPIPGNGASANQMVNKLFRAGANVLIKSIPSNLYTTGHALQGEQKLMLQLIKPKHSMLVRGEYKVLTQYKETGKRTGPAGGHIFTCANGDVLILRNHQVFGSSWRIQADDIYVDGNDISGVSTAVLKNRTTLADNGPVAVIIAIDFKENKVLCKLVIVSRDFVLIEDSQGLLREAEQIVYAALNEKMKERTTFSELKNCVRSILEPFLYNKTHRNPIVILVTINSKTVMATMAQARVARATKRPTKKKEPQNAQSQIVKRLSFLMAMHRNP